MHIMVYLDQVGTTVSRRNASVASRLNISGLDEHNLCLVDNSAAENGPGQRKAFSSTVALV